MKYYFTSESVTEGHPDKICDKISDKILDYALKHDKDSKMAVEATIKDDLVLVYGEAKTKANIDYEKLAKEVLKDIGYNENYNIIIKVSEQSSEINNAVAKKRICAGDQGIMFGYATNETKELMPLPIMLANKLAKRLTDVRKNDENTFLKPDGKTAVTVLYEDDKPIMVDTIIIAASHTEDISKEKLDSYIIENVINKVIPNEFLRKETKILINTSGKFTICGSFGDSGTTGRKIICDTYGGMGKVGGGCFSSKDPSKVDRSGAYYTRYVAKHLVAANLCDKALVQVAYAIGIPTPVSIHIDTYNTNKVEMSKLYEIVNTNFDLRVANIINELHLKTPMYKQLAAYGHMGREDLNVRWEDVNKLKNWKL